MCNRCVEIDAKIAHYRKLSAAVTDRVVLEHLNTFIAVLESEKTTLHCEVST